MSDLKEKVKNRGITALLEDREILFDKHELKLAVKAGIFATLKKTGTLISIRDVEQICEDVCNAAEKRAKR